MQRRRFFKTSLRPLLLLLACLLSVAGFSARVDTLDVPSATMNRTLRTAVVLPDAYTTPGKRGRNNASTATFPVLYLLHGGGGSYRDWLTRTPDKTLLHRLSDQYNLIIVTPDGDPTSYYFDSPLVKTSQFETFIAKELIDKIDATYRTTAGRAGRVIAGLSMGGHGAMFIASRHPDLYAAAGSMSGVMNINTATWKVAPDFARARNENLTRLLGPAQPGDTPYPGYTMVTLADKLNTNGLPLIFDTGVDDFLIEGNRDLHRQLVANGTPHDYIERPGGHTWDYWENALPYQVLFFSKVLKAHELASAPINVTGGQISGTPSTDGTVRMYKGIPFAAPPMGKLRWREPQPVVAWSGVRRCETFGPSPMQGAPVPFGPWSAEYLIPKDPISEDCLYLNVWSGAKATTAKQPVLVWIYGGGFSSGGAGCAIYDGAAMAKKGIVFVSINYRVGPFGFLAHPELTKESGRAASGNYGLMDQIAALQWVKQNIAAFGGNPNNVTIAGQSAGSMAVNCLVASPLAKGLFSKAIAQSGASVLQRGSIGGATLQQAEESGVKTMQALNATSLTEMRALSAEDILKKAQGSIRGPVVDGYVLPQSVAAILAAGQQNDVALLTGWNEDEGMAFGKPKTADEYRQQAERQYGTNASAYLQHYPGATDAEAARSQIDVSRDQIFGMQNYAWANLQARQNMPVYIYRFTRKLPATGQYAHYGAFHTGEVAYAYDNLRFIDHSLRPLDKTDDELARLMSGYWANFVKTGNPNGPGLPQWPAYKTTDKEIIVLGDQVQAKPLPDAARLDFLIMNSH